VTGRIANTLLDLAKQPDAMTHPDGMQIKITRQEIGQIVGCSRETVGRIWYSLINSKSTKEPLKCGFFMTKIYMFSLNEKPTLIIPIPVFIL
jgi:hypothetical protein